MRSIRDSETVLVEEAPDGMQVGYRISVKRSVRRNLWIQEFDLA